MPPEILRLISNICLFGTVSETKSDAGYALARVKIDDRVTDFFPILSQSNTFKKHFIPIRVGEQVMVICPYGEANIGLVLRSVFNKNSKEPTGSNNEREVITYEDGTTIFYDTKLKELNIEAVGMINITCKEATIKADTVDITATTSNTGDVSIKGSLSVTGKIVGESGIAISGGTGATFDGNITTTGDISDSRGSLTNHTNHGYGRD